MNLERNDIDIIDVDTALVGFQNEYPYLQNNVGSAYLGNLGAASVPLDYFLRPQYRNFSFAQPLMPTCSLRNGCVISMSRSRLRICPILCPGRPAVSKRVLGAHAQNVSPSTGFNVDYRSRGTRGIYTWQGTRERNLSLAFSHTGKKVQRSCGLYLQHAER